MMKRTLPAVFLAAAVFMLVLCKPDPVIGPGDGDDPAQTDTTQNQNPQKDTSDTPTPPVPPVPDDPERPEAQIYSCDIMKAMWGDTNLMYGSDKAVSDPCDAFPYTAWRGEKVNAEIVIYALSALSDVTVSSSELKSWQGVIPSTAVETHFLRYVTGDVLSRDWGDCSAHEIGSRPSLSVADRLSDEQTISVIGRHAQPVWLSVDVPRDVPAGVYTGTVTISAMGSNILGISCRLNLELPVWLRVDDHILPPVKDWGYHLDFWQTPEFVNRYSGSVAWSDAHFDSMKPLMKMLADAGQKCITCQISNSRMVTKIRNADGSWTYNYSIFDKWVQMMMDCGITGQIDCYGVVPWDISFDYVDKVTGASRTVTDGPGTQGFEDYWTPFLTDFKKHLEEKGWFDRTYLAFDERPEDSLLKTFQYLKKVAPEFRISHTGTYFDSLEPYCDIMCIVYYPDYPDGIVESRRARGAKSTYYTACGQRYPNSFIDSYPGEGVWCAWAARSMGLDGYLRWAYNKWDNDDPLNDARHWGGPSGDRFIVYPVAQSSVRFEKIAEGVRDYEKTGILVKEWTADGNASKLADLETALRRFNYIDISTNGPDPAIHQARMVLEPQL